MLLISPGAGDKTIPNSYCPDIGIQVKTSKAVIGRAAFVIFGRTDSNSQ
jgi:hypothetical protein